MRMYPPRKELVGKRFLCVHDNSSRSSINRPNSRSNRLSDPLDYPWKCGIIRACTEQDSNHPEQKVLIEYDNEDWTTREWLQVYSDTWKIFLVEKNMVWAQRVDPNYPRRSLLWPALTFYPLVDKHGLDENKSIGVEFLSDHLRAFCQANEMRAYQEDDGLQPALRNNSKVLEELLNWQTLQKSQGILIHGPFTLTGFRVQVYREKCRQWFSAVITSHDLITREMDVMDDTVLQTHRINPRLVMVLLLANDVELDSMLRGDLVRVLPVRRNRQAQVVITSSYTSTTPNTAPGNSMWQFLNNIWRDPSSATQVQPSAYHRQAICSPSVSMTTPRVATATNSSTTDHKRRTHDFSRNNKRQSSIDLQSTPDKDIAAGLKPNSDSRLLSLSDDKLEQDRKGPKEFGASIIQQELENSTKNLSLKHPNSSPVPGGFLHSSPIRIASPVHYPLPYSSLENLSNSNTNPQSGSKCNISPQRSFGSSQKSSPLLSSSTLIRASPVDQRSPPKILDSQHPHFSSPSHPFSPTPTKRQYTPPSSSSNFSPLRTNKLSPVLSSPAMHGHISLQSSGLPVSTACINPLGHSHDAHQMMGAYSCATRQSTPQNLMTNQLYALQLQQQRQIQNQQLQQLQHEQNISQFYMQMNQLQLMAEQLKSSQQGALSSEQREALNFYYNQIMSQYQQANLLKYHPAVASQDSTLLAADQQMQILKEQLKYFNDHQEQSNVKWQHSLPEKDQLQSFLSHMQQNANIEHLPNLYPEFTNQASKDSVQQEDDSVQDHVARLKRFIPSKQEQLKAKSQTSSTLSLSSDSKDTLPISITSFQSPSPLKESMSCGLPLIQAAEKENGNKTDDQKVVDALVRKPSVSECPSSSVETDNLSDTLMATNHEFKADSILPQNTMKNKLEEQLATQETKKSNSSPSKDDDPFGFDGIGDDAGNEQSSAMMSSSLDQSSDNSIGFNASTKIEQKKSSKSTNNMIKKGKKTVANTLVDHKASTKANLSLKTSPESISSRESVIKYVVNKSEPLVSSLDFPNQEALLDTEPLPFSVDQLLEFHKTSAQAAVKIFKQNNEFVKPLPDAKQTQGKKRKKEGKKKSEDKKDISTKKSVKCVKQTKTQRKRSKHEEGSREMLIEGSDEDTRPVLESSNEAVGNDCKKQKLENQKSESRPTDSILHVVNKEEEKICRYPFKDTSLETLLTCTEMISSNKVDILKLNPEDNRVLYERSSTQNQNQLYSRDISVPFISNKGSNIMTDISESVAAIPVNFVADQAVKSLTTVGRATEPVPAISFCGIEYVVEQIETHSEAPFDSVLLKSETTRQRKKSRKVIENELNELEQDKVEQEENEKTKKKSKIHQKNDIKTSMDETTDNVGQEAKETLSNVTQNKTSKKTSKDDNPDNIDQEETFASVTKNKNSKKSTVEEASKDPNGNEKLVKDTKNKKRQKKSKEEILGNIDHEETSTTVTKKKKSKKISVEEASKDQKGKEKLVKGTKKKKSKKESKEETLDHVDQEEKGLLATDTKNTESEISTDAEASKDLKEEDKLVKSTKNKKCKEESKEEILGNIDQEETSTTVTKKKKNKRESKEEILGNIDQEETSTTVTKKKKSKRESKEEILGNIDQEETSTTVTKKKKSKKTSEEETGEVKKMPTTDKETKMLKTEMDQGKKAYMASINIKSNQKDVDIKIDGSQMNSVGGNNTAANLRSLEEVKAVDIDHDGFDPVKAEVVKSSAGKKAKEIQQENVMDWGGNMKEMSEEKKDKRKQDKKPKQPKPKTSTEQEDKKSKLEKEFEDKQDYSCREIGPKDLEESETRLECSKIVQNEEKMKDQNQKNEDMEKITEKSKEDSKTNGKLDDKDNNRCVVAENGLKEIKEQISGSKKSNVEKTISIKKRSQDAMCEELSPKKKKQKVKQPAEEYFLQNSGCLAFSKLPRCRDCRDKEENPSEGSQECCRFTLFRRLKKKKRSERVRVAGFLAPENAELEDFQPWIAHKEVVNTLSKEEALYIISNVADEFCSLVQEEKGAKALMAEGSFVAYKRAVIGLREMCDACATTIFNIHWVCQKCGFGVCLDCYELRIKEKTMLKCGKKAFEFKWFNCVPGLTHQPKNLTIAQIIPNKVLNDLSEQLHYIQSLWNIEKKCPCNNEPDKRIKVGLPEVSTLPCNPETDLEYEQVKEEMNTSDTFNKIEQETKQENEGAVQQVVKKTIMERVRERLRDKIDAQKSTLTVTWCQEEQITTNKASPKKESSDCSTTTMAVDNTSAMNVSDTRLRCNGGTDSDPNEREEEFKNNPSFDLERVDEVKTSQKKECNENRTTEDIKLTDERGIISMSSGLSLLMSYDSSSEDSPPSTPSKRSSGTHTFDFNLGLLALVASNEQEKRTEVTNIDQQPQQHEQGPLEQGPLEQGPLEQGPLEQGPLEREPHESEPLEHRHEKQQENDKNRFKENLKKEKMMDWVKSVDEEQIKVVEENKNCNEKKSSVGESTSMPITMETDVLRNQQPLDAPRITEDYPAPHTLLCNGRLLRLHEPHHPGNQEAFAKRWIKGKPVLVSDVDKLLDGNLWSPGSFEREFGEELADVVNCRTGKTLENFGVGAFWKGFESVQDRIKDSNGEPMLLKLKDWPPAADFSEKLPSRFKNLMDYIPLPEYTRRDKARNLSSRLPDFFVKPDLGPKMYNAYGSAAFPTEGTTNLHIDMSDAVNIMVYVGVPREKSAGEQERKDAIKAVDLACDEIQQQRVRRETARIGALWHIFDVDDADNIREFLHEVAKERKSKYPAHHDPIHDQCFYLDHELRERLKSDYNVEGYAVCQCLGDGVFIPAGAPHQVRNLYSCIKIAEDFVSPERIGQCLKTTQEFRHLTDKHSNHEDKLQIKNIIYHAVKDAVYILKNHKSQQTNNTELN